jgi:hypothetical protein
MWGEAWPYLNTELGGFAYKREPPAVALKIWGRLISGHAARISSQTPHEGRLTIGHAFPTLPGP